MAWLSLRTGPMKTLLAASMAIAPLLSLGLLPSIARAHAITTDYRLLTGTGTGGAEQSTQLEIQSTFSETESFPNAPVVVYSPENPDQPWMTGTTDENGKFAFEPEPGVTGTWSVEIGEDSHWDQLNVPVGDRGIEFEQISRGERSHWVANHTHSPIPFAAAGLILGGIATRRLWTQSKN